jgi:hypothetical protein
MPATFASQAFEFAPAADAFRAEPADLLGFDDLELEQALKAVSWNPRDVAQYLRSARATGGSAVGGQG